MKNDDNRLLEKLFVLFIQDFKLYAINDNKILKSRELARTRVRRVERARFGSEDRHQHYQALNMHK